MTCADTFQLQSFDVIETNKVNDTCESVCVYFQCIPMIQCINWTTSKWVCTCMYLYMCMSVIIGPKYQLLDANWKATRKSIH